MKKNNKRGIIFLLTSMFTLTACSTFGFSYSPYSYKIEPKTHEELSDNSTFFRPISFTKSYQDVFRSHPTKAKKTINLDQKGEVNLLVLPISFSDYTANELDGKNGENARIVLENAFFGKEDRTQWESVASYYDKVSYGQLKIKGEVMPWYELPSDYSVAAINDKLSKNNDKQVLVMNILRAAVRNFKVNFPEKVADYDLNNDNVIDAVYLVYSYPFTEVTNGNKINESFFWAYTSFDNNIHSHNVEIEGPGPYANAFSWSSYHFLNLRQSIGKNKPDTHTFIHETGHFLGLPDYYNTLAPLGNNPLGGFDMMDLAVGDHSGLSKMLFEWTYPNVVTGEGEIKIRPFNKSGDLILLTNDWNGSALDEYILLEYYAPTGINRLDSFANSTFNLPSDYGIKVYHVDARTVYVDVSISPHTVEYSEGKEKPENALEDLAHTNTDGGVRYKLKDENGNIITYPLYKLLERSGENTFENGNKAENATLFTKNVVFGEDVFSDFTFHSKGKLPYNFEITSLTKNYAIIKFMER